MMEGMNQSTDELELTDPSDEDTSINIQRCAVCTRVSSSNQDDTPLSSIEAQIESCKSYIQAQKGIEEKKRGNLTPRVHKSKRGGPQKQGLPGIGIGGLL